MVSHMSKSPTKPWFMSGLLTLGEGSSRCIFVHWSCVHPHSFKIGIHIRGQNSGCMQLNLDSIPYWWVFSNFLILVSKNAGSFQGLCDGCGWSLGHSDSWNKWKPHFQMADSFFDDLGRGLSPFNFLRKRTSVSFGWISWSLQQCRQSTAILGKWRFPWPWGYPTMDGL